MPEASPASDVQGQTGTTDLSGQTAASATAQQTQDASPASSSGDQGVKPRSMLEAVSAAVKQTEAGASPAQQAGSDQAKKPGDPNGEKAEGDKPGDLSDDELAHLSERAQRRFRALSTEVKELKGQIEAIRSDAEVGRQITDYVARANLDANEVNIGFEIMRLMKAGDPFAAQQMLAPYWEALQQATGQRLPPDLQDAVDNGRVTEALAREIAQTRAKAAATGEQLQRHTQQTEQERRQREQKAHVDGVARAVTDFERQWEQSDPDYKLKASRVHEKVELRIRRDGYPKAAAEAVDTVKSVIKEVEAELATFRPAPKPIVPITGGGTTPTAQPAPKTMLDLVKQQVGVR